MVLHTPPGAGPNWLFIAVPDDKVIKNRIHFDFRPDDQQAEVDRVLALGARHVDIGQGDESGWCWPIPRATSSASWPRKIDLAPRDRACLHVDTPQNACILRTLGAR